MKKSLPLLGTFACAIALAATMPAKAQERGAGGNVVEEIIVTARQQEETLQDVPVTVAALTETDLERYNISTLTEASKLVPSFYIYHGGSGNGSNLYLRGVGSSSISAAFDQSVAVNVDGVVVNIGRFIHNAYMDMGQLEVLKGPQSLYFGKSATAGVVSITSNDPGDEFEFEAMLGYEFEHDQRYAEAVLSGPLSDSFGARLAIGYTDSNELFRNLAHDVGPAHSLDGVRGATHKWGGEEALNTRLTLLWNPNETFRLRTKYSYSQYDNNGANRRTEEICPQGRVQGSAIPAGSLPFAIFQGVDDCKLNGNTSIADLHPVLALGLPHGGDSGIPFLDQDTHFISAQADWDLNETLSFTSVTGYVDLDHVELEVYDYNAGVYGGQHRNIYKSFSQEFRLATNFDGPVNFLLGGYYQDVEQEFHAWQYAFNLAVAPTITATFLAGLGGITDIGVFGLDPTAPTVGPDPATGNGYDYNKNHFLDTKVYSAFIAGYWDITESLELTAGVRYTDESKDGYITIPYMHVAAALFGFGAPELIEGLEFDDDNLSPEVAVNWHANDQVSLFASYKQGFKSGGVDNSALPTAALQPTNPAFPDFLIYASEEASGFEMGMKSNLLEGSMRLNASAFTYDYDDLQVQLFNAQAIQFFTSNASKLRTQGIEADLLWLTDVEGLTVRAAAALTDSKLKEDFINASGQNLKGERANRAPKFAGNLGLDYDWPAMGGWRAAASLDLRYSSSYSYSATLDPYTQGSYAIVDAALRLYSEDRRYEIALIGRNLSDKIYALGAGSRPGACVNQGPPAAPIFEGSCDGTAPANAQDQVTTTSLGRQLTLQFRARL